MHAYQVLLLVLGSYGLCFATDAPKAKESRVPLPDRAVRRLGEPDFRTGGEILGLAAVPGGKQVVASTRDEVSLWNVESGRCLAASPTPVNALKLTVLPAEAYKSAPLSSNGKFISIVWEGRLYTYPITLDAPPKRTPVSFDTTFVHTAAYLPNSGKLVGLSVTGRPLGEPRENPFRKGTNPFRKEKPAEPTQPKWGSIVGFTAVGGTKSFAVGGDLVAYTGDKARADERFPTVYVGNPTQWQSLRSFEVPGLQSQSLSVSGDGKWIATVAGGEPANKLQVWKVGGTRNDFQEVQKWAAPATAVTAMSADGRIVAGASGEDGKVWLFDVETGKELPVLSAPGDQIRHLAFLPNGETLVAGGATGVIRVWNPRTGKPIHPESGHTGAVRAVVLFPDGACITAGSDHTVRLWDTTGKEVRRFDGHTGAVVAAILSADAKTLFTASADGTVRAWDTAKGTELRSFAVGKAGGGVRCLTLSGDGKTLATGTTGGAIYLLDPGSLKVTKTLAGDAGPVGGVGGLVFATGGILVSRDAGGMFSIWDVAKGTDTYRFVAPATKLDASRLAVSPNGKTIAGPLGEDEKAASPAVDLGVWDIASGKLLHRIQIGRRENQLTAVAYLPDGKAVVVGDTAGKVWVVDLEKIDVRQKFEGHRGPALSLAVSPDGKTVASGGADTTVLVWDLTRVAP